MIVISDQSPLERDRLLPDHARLVELHPSYRRGAQRAMADIAAITVRGGDWQQINARINETRGAEARLLLDDIARELVERHGA